MKGFARFIALGFLMIGGLIILGGIGFAFSGAFSQTPTPPVPSIIPDMSGLMNVVRVIGGGAIGLQGMFLVAIGQGLWLLAGIYEQTEQTSKALSGLIRRNNNQAKP